jgi:Spy/CpxP family protein refolding chaperone
VKSIVLTLTVAALAASPMISRAQDERAERPGGPGARMNPEERLKTMTEKLGLSDEQQNKIKAIMDEGREKMKEFRDLQPEERREKNRAFMQEQNAKIQAVLTPEQQEKYKDLRPRREGGPAGEKRGEGKGEKKE